MAPYLKRRILGAVITVVVIAIALPVVLDTTRHLENPFVETEALPEVPSWAQVQHQKTDRDELERIASGKNQEDLFAKPEPLLTQDEPMPSAPSFSAQAAPRDTPPLAQLPLAWVLQVGAFGEQKNAQEMIQKLRSKQYKAFAETLPNGQLTRVYIGPELERANIERLQQRVQADLKQKDIHIKQWRPSR